MLEQLIISIQIILIDIVMAADNLLIIIGLIAALFCNNENRRKNNRNGAAAFLFRIVFASGANYLFEFLKFLEEFYFYG